mgnify:CR=1 FL=1
MDSLYKKYFNELLNLNPSINDFLGLEEYKNIKHRFENTLDDTYISKQKDLCKKYLTLVKKKEKLNHFDRVLKYNLSLELEYYDYQLIYLTLDHENNPISFFCETAAGDLFYKFKTNKDYYDFVLKTKDFVKYLESCIRYMKVGIEKKIILPKILSEKLYDQLIDIVKNKPYIKKNVPKNLKIDYNKTIEDLLLPVLKKLILFMKTEYIKNSRNTYGISNLPNGKKMYEYLVRKNLGLKSVNIKDIHDYGLSEVKRIQNEMIAIKNRFSFKGNLQKFNEYFKNRKDLKFKNKQELLKIYRSMQKEINNTVIKQLFKTDISHECLITPVPKFNEKHAPSAYYIPGSIDKKRKGKFYINCLNLEDLSKAEVESLTLHETIPGHHFQLTTMLDSKLPLFIKSSSGNETAYEEGWALYCETLGEYKTKESYYGKLNAEMLRAVRLVVDTGIHYYNWNPEKSIKYMMKYCFDDKDIITSEVYRYMAYPAQALSYKMGERIFHKLKKKYVDSGKLDIKEFHKRCLRFGSMPIHLLESSF